MTDSLKCDHSMYLFATMQTIKADRDFYYRKCSVCKEEEKLPRAGKIWCGTSIEAETFRDFERREFAKEHLQGYEPDGSVNELFDEAYGDPKIRGKAKVGGKMDKLQIKDKPKK